MYLKDALSYASKSANIVYNPVLSYMVEINYSGLTSRAYAEESTTVRKYYKSDTTLANSETLKTSKGIAIQFDTVTVVPLKYSNDPNWQVIGSRNVAISEIKNYLKGQKNEQ